jgi:ABC-type transport system involved in multi-copper enzyme maturation permease subunit
VIRRIGAIVRADFLIRFRRPSTVIVFLLLSGFAYVWIPDPATGRALMQINGSRVLYNSAAIGMATSMLASMFVGLFGFYVISNAVRRDIDSRCGYVIASTTMRTSEYIAGKFLGNVVFLSTFTVGYMAASMVMLLVRGEAPLEPLIFMKQYALMTPPAIVFVSVVAIVFESIPFLSGRFGDVAYFFLYATSLGLIVNMMIHGGTAARYFDVSGFGYLMEQTQRAFHTQSMSIGSSPFNAAKPVLTIGGLNLEGGALLARIASTIAPVPLLVLARLFFHRFDPARLRAASAKGKRGWMSQFNAMARPLVRPIAALPVRGAALKDAMMTFASTPFTGIALIGITIASIAAPASLPITFVIAAIFIASVASRDRSAGTIGLIYAAPRLRERFVTWKLASSAIVTLLLLVAPLFQRAVVNPSRLPALLIGIAFVAAAATSLGVISGNPKTFIVCFLTFWYVVVNDHGKTPAFDFAGFFATPALTVTLTYAAISIALLATAEVVHRLRLRT